MCEHWYLNPTPLFNDEDDGDTRETTESPPPCAAAHPINSVTEEAMEHIIIQIKETPNHDTYQAYSRHIQRIMMESQEGVRIKKLHTFACDQLRKLTTPNEIEEETLRLRMEEPRLDFEQYEERQEDIALLFGNDQDAVSLLDEHPEYFEPLVEQEPTEAEVALGVLHQPTDTPRSQIIWSKFGKDYPGLGGRITRSANSPLYDRSRTEGKYFSSMLQIIDFSDQSSHNGRKFLDDLFSVLQKEKETTGFEPYMAPTRKTVSNHVLSKYGAGLEPKLTQFRVSSVH